MTTKKVLLLTLCLLMALSGCAKDPDAPAASDSPSSPIVPESSIAENDPPLLGDDQWSAYQWMRTGGVAARRREKIDFTDEAGHITHTFAPLLSDWPGAPEADIWGESFCSYTIGERYIFAHFSVYGGPAIMRHDNKPTLVNAAILDNDGRLIRAFPSGDSTGMKPLHNNTSFVDSVARRTTFLWMDDDLLAVNTGTHLWLYSVGEDELRTKADYTDEVFNGWTQLESHGYGAIEGSMWAQDGTLYYARGHGFTQDVNHNGRQQLLRTDWDEEPTVISGDDTFTTFKWSGGRFFAMLLESRVDSSGNALPACRFWCIDPSSNTLTYVGETTDYFEPVARGNLVAWYNYTDTTESYLHVAYQLHTLDLATGERLSFAPTTQSGFPKNTRLVDTFALTDVSQSGTDTLLYYTFMNTREERRAPEDFAHYLACHNLTSGETVFLDLISDQVVPRPDTDTADALLVIAYDNKSFEVHPMPVA